MTQLEEKIAGEITMADKPGHVIRKWRKMFNVSQTTLAKSMDVSPSVISDYEQGRRTPGTSLVHKIVTSLIFIDKERGGEMIDRFTPPGQEGIIKMDEFSRSISVDELKEAVEGKILNKGDKERSLYGYTMIDSLKAIVKMKSFDYLRIYGWSTERALFFTGVEHGRSPMVAIRSSPLTPALVCYVQPNDVDDLSIKLASVEGIFLMKTDIDIKELKENLDEVQGRS